MPCCCHYRHARFGTEDVAVDCLERSGSRWKAGSGEQVVNLRAFALNDRWDTAMAQTLAPLRKAVYVGRVRIAQDGRDSLLAHSEGCYGGLHTSGSAKCSLFLSTVPSALRKRTTNLSVNEPGFWLSSSELAMTVLV